MNANLFAGRKYPMNVLTCEKIKQGGDANNGGHARK